MLPPDASGNVSHDMNRLRATASEGDAPANNPVSMTVTDTTAYQFVHVGPRNRLLYHRRRVQDAAVLALAEGLALLVALGLANRLDLWLTGAASWPTWAWGMPLLWWMVAVFSRLLPGWGLGAAEELRRIVIGLMSIFVGVAALLFLTKRASGDGRFLLATGWVLATGAVPLARWLAKRWLIYKKRWGAPTVIYGANGIVEEVIEMLRQEAGLGYQPIGVFYADEACVGDRMADLPVMGGLWHNTPDAPVAVLALPGIAPEMLSELLDGPLSIYKQVILILDLSDVPSLWVRPCNLSGRLALEITPNLFDPVAQTIKRTMDLVLVVGTMPIWMPLVGLLALAVWLEDRQKPFFTQERIGRNGRRFCMIKLRTMRPDAEAVLRRYLEENPEARAEWAASFKLKNDPRITRVGRWLRKLSLDELPQLFNVLRGEMSLVGPRPLPAYHHDELPHLVQQLRVRVRPGMTGLWQVNGRSDAGNEGMARWDAFYIRNWSIWLDLVILVRTIRVVIKGHGAY